MTKQKTVSTGILEVELFQLNQYTRLVRKYALFCGVFGFTGAMMLLIGNIVALWVAYCCFLATFSVALRWLWVIDLVDKAHKFRLRRLQSTAFGASVENKWRDDILKTPAYLRRTEVKFESQKE